MRLKVLFLSSWFPSRVSPRLGNFVFAHAEAVARYHDVTVAYLVSDPTANRIEIEEEHLDEIRIVRAYYPKGKRFIGRYKAFKLILRHLKMERGRFDIAQLNMVWNEGWQAVWLKKKYGLPFVISDNWTGYHPDQRGPLPWHIRRYMRWVGNHAALLVPVTQHLLQAMRRLGFRPDAEIVPNAVAVDTFEVFEKESTPVHFLHVSHLDQNHKNIEGILQVWKRFCAQGKDVFLSIGGDGDWTAWRRRAEELEIPAEGITFFGPLTREEVAEKMRHAHCMLLFSNYENLPLVMIEGMACGLSIIATDVGGISEHIAGHPEHCLISARDEEALLKVLERTAENADRIDRLAIRKYAVDRFSFNAVGMAFTKAYLRSLGK